MSGFTLIELLIVIAIIGILAAILIPNLLSARNKASDAAIKGTATGLKAQGLLFADSNSGSYVGVCADTSFAALVSGAISNSSVTTAASVNAIQSASTSVCNATATGFAVSIPLKTSSTQYFCVDSAGSGKVVTGVLPAATTVTCPAA